MNPPAILIHPSDVSLAWLNHVLRRHGSLKTGAVVDFLLADTQSTNAFNARLTLTYSDDALGTLPKNVFLKMCSPHNSSTGEPFGDSEPLYYSRDYVDLEDAPVAACFDAQYCPDQRAYHVLLEDYSDTHTPAWDLEPNPAYGVRLAHAFGKLHAHHSPPPGSLTSPDQWNAYFDHVLAGLDPLLAEVPDAGRQDILRQVAHRHPSLMRTRSQDPTGQSLLHGDANPGNILVPREEDGRLFFIDRQPFDWSLTTWLGVSDIAYATVLWWDPAKRRELETPLLETYHTVLRNQGVTNYTWEQLWEDYRLAVIGCLYVPIEWCVQESDRTTMRWVWEPQLEKCLAAFRDLDCAKVLD